MKNRKIALLLMIVQVTTLLSVSDQKAIERIAREIHTIAPQCKTASIAEIKAKRLQFLNKNKDATAKDLFKALQMEIDGYNIISLLRSYDSEVSEECADIIEADYELANDAVNWWCGGITLERAMQLGVLK